MFIVVMIFAVVLLVLFLRLHLRRRRRAALIAITNMTLGVTSLVLMSPIFLAVINIPTVFVSLVLGIPGAVLVSLATLLG